MIEETIRKLEERLNSSTSINEENRQELLGLLQDLKGEVSKLSKTDTAHVEKILSDSAEAATGQQGSSESLEAHLRNLSASVDGFENSHPQLVQVVNRIAETLSNLGI